MADAKTLKQEQTALFRYAVIFPLLDERLGQGDQARILDEISAKDYEIPFSTRRKVSRGTAARWLTLYRKGGIDALHPRGRQDKSHTSSVRANRKGKIRVSRKGTMNSQEKRDIKPY